MSTSSIYEVKLHNAWAASNGKQASALRKRKLRDILITSTHKTYKYIFINGLLGMAAAGHNPLVLQKGSSLPDAWDARSVCHKHLVPFERDTMDGRLGNSNEPFLNKPARFPELSLNNAVRPGRDREVLSQIIDVFKSLKSCQDAYDWLIDALAIVREIPPQKIEFSESIDRGGIFRSVQNLLNHNLEGEALVFAVGLIYASLLPKDFKIECHPTNQSGASSREVADIDIHLGKSIHGGIEVKDKEFTEYDVAHARAKANQQGVFAFVFVSREAYIRSAYKNNMQLEARHGDCIISIEDLMKIFQFSVLPLSKELLEEFTASFISDVRPKTETVDVIAAAFG